MDWICLEQTDSTNRYAKELARSGAPHGTAVLAQRQTGGRGRMGRDFYSPLGGIYLSLILRPGLAAEDVTLIPTMAALSVCRTLEEAFDLRPRIKWVNDLYLGDKKICGVLCELCGDAVILGVGLNYTVSERGFPPELKAAALFPAGREPIPLQRSAELICQRLLADLTTLPDTGFLEDYRQRELLLGHAVTVHPAAGEPYGARAVDIDGRGRLVIEKNGRLQTLDSGLVSVRI